LKPAENSVTPEMWGTKFLEAGQSKILFPWWLPLRKENVEKKYGGIDEIAGKMIAGKLSCQTGLFPN